MSSYVFLPVGCQARPRIARHAWLIVCLQLFHPNRATTTTATTTWGSIIASDRESITRPETLEDTSSVVSQGAVGSQDTLIMRIVTTLLDWGLQARLVESYGVGSSMRLELMMPIGMEEGEVLLSWLLPDRAETPPWECGCEVNEDSLDLG
jgi:hypothetical protein